MRRPPRFPSRLVPLALLGSSALLLAACSGNGADGADGADGRGTLSKVTDTPADETCPTGGHRVDLGLDANGDGALEASEIGSSVVVCDGDVGRPGPKGDTGDAGKQGADGQPGAPGHDSLIVQTKEPRGSNCPFGGVKIESGVDLDGDHQLDPSEVTQTSYVCGARESSLRIVFVASQLWNGTSGGGLAGADAQCTALAAVEPALAGKPFRAWMSDSHVSAAQRLAHDGRFVRTDGKVVADDWADLTDGSLDAPINIDEHGQWFDPSQGVFTGTYADGSAAANTCGDWSDPGAGFYPGGPANTDDGWSYRSYIWAGCADDRQIYCFEE